MCHFNFSRMIRSSAVESNSKDDWLLCRFAPNESQTNSDCFLQWGWSNSIHPAEWPKPEKQNWDFGGIFVGFCWKNPANAKFNKLFFSPHPSILEYPNFQERAPIRKFWLNIPITEPYRTISIQEYQMLSQQPRSQLQKSLRRISVRTPILNKTLGSMA